MLNENSGQKDDRLCDSIYIKRPERGIDRDRKQLSSCLGLGWERGLTSNSHEQPFWNDENVLKTGLW